MKKTFQILCAIILILCNLIVAGCCVIASMEQYDGLESHLSLTPYFNMPVSIFYLVWNICGSILCVLIYLIWSHNLGLLFVKKDDDVNYRAGLEKWSVSDKVQFVDGDEIPT